MKQRAYNRVLIMVMVFFTVGSATTLFADQQKRLALVIGNADYTHAPTLRNPARDAKAMSAKLKGLGFKVITVVNGTYRRMVTAREEFASELNQYNVGLFYYSGHGVQYQGTNYLVPVNANIRRAVDIQFEALNASRVLADMQSSGTGVNIMILDACRNNPFVTQFRSLARGLSVVQAPAGSMVVYSTAPDQVALDGTGKDSPFTAALLRNISTPGISISDMLTSVFQQVQHETHGQQVPWESSSLTQPFYFASKPPAVASQKTPAKNRATPAPAAKPAPSQPSQSGSGQTTAKQANTPPEPGRFVLRVHPAEAVAQAKVTLTASGAGRAIGFTMETNSPHSVSLPPGTYNLKASLAGDTGVGYQDQIHVGPGQQVGLTVPLDYSTSYKVALLRGKRHNVSAQLSQLQHERRSKGGGALFLTLLALASGGGGYFAYTSGSAAYGSYQSAMTATDAQTYRSQVLTDSALTVAGGVGSGIFLLWALGELHGRPSPQQESALQNSMDRLDAEIQALRAREALPK